ncbi:uncharacterized protein [Physcomitrium patens]|nr:uncharacterized protein LOC112276712 isoform X2 [Physcomitrium patens]XP_024364061.1 uncharacterized protein LOC112276712 isoform X2 [Physcomitrium patens]XP_024364062.1 uncharacterized protein LOC112276712 isoform X2 [Physcomitrium patens]XP_024364063.1 uncharacterized protein LOC112276712 isoform X2 [Physcomitrium patens]XP_024364064.1 uncharacterized protein LOC112276712 isoform X2 [Physcomitrium patens]XP_024364066.1 uncharacterized protein LOC112276712 isoform X2 [Physcomitrium patens]|eukprot:XP_024364060.1 uncharacterized protein LOC112276712 isoform X2 [Physcomitrella patens]
MGRGRFLSRKQDEPAKAQPDEESTKLKNPFVQLGLALKNLQKLTPQPLTSSSKSEANVPRRPLVDINEVRSIVRKKLAITKEISTIPIQSSNHSFHGAVQQHRADADSSTETTHVWSEHSYSSNESSLPAHDAKSGTRPFDIGTVGHSILEVNEPRRGSTLSSAGMQPPSTPGAERSETRQAWTSAGTEPSSSIRFEVSDLSSGEMAEQSTTVLEMREPTGANQPSTISLELDDSRGAPSSAGMEQPTITYTWSVEPPASDVDGALLDMKDVQEFVASVVQVVKRFENWGLPQTSWENKMPWHSPPPKILAKGLQRPPQSFASDQERLAFNRNARKRNKFLTGCPPTWSFMVANLLLIGFLVSNPFG